MDCFGIPIDATPRRLERMAIAFLATADIKSINDFKSVKDFNSGYSLKTRDVINYVNLNFGENIRSGSYDDKEKGFKTAYGAEVVLRSSPNSATNDSTRGYCVNPLYAELIRNYGVDNWEKLVTKKLQGIEPLNQKN